MVAAHRPASAQTAAEIDGASSPPPPMRLPLLPPSPSIADKNFMVPVGGAVIAARSGATQLVRASRAGRRCSPADCLN